MYERLPSWTLCKVKIFITQAQIIKSPLVVWILKITLRIFKGWNLDKLKIILRLGWKLLILIKTSPPNARVASMTSMRTNNFKTLRLKNTLESSSKHFWNTYETLVKHCLKHSWKTGETLVKHWWNTGETLVKHWWNTGETLVKHW